MQPYFSSRESLSKEPTSSSISLPGSATRSRRSQTSSRSASHAPGWSNGAQCPTRPPGDEHRGEDVDHYEAAAAHARRLGASCNSDWWQAKAAEAAEQRQEAERLVAESERKHAEEKKAYEKALLAADEARRTGGRRG
jgi:hypothetical protein